AKDYQSFCFWENRNLHKSICDWFFPRQISDIPILADQESECDKFFSTHRFLMGEAYIIEHAEFYHLHGHNF
ncbi:MAG: hypothetical protein ACRC36_05245, partial [Lacrimispora sphenoides]